MYTPTAPATTPTNLTQEYWFQFATPMDGPGISYMIRTVNASHPYPSGPKTTQQARQLKVLDIVPTPLENV